MISFAHTQEIISLVLLFFAYIFSITISGNMQSYIAKKCGDATSADLGFTEFNPFIFINWFDIIWFLLFKIMVGRPVPLELRYGMDRRYRWWRTRVFLIFASRTLCNILIAMIASLSSIIFFLLTSNPGTISLLSLLFLFCIALMNANVFLATFECCRQAIHFFIMYKLEKDYRFIEHSDYMLVLGPLLLWIFFGRTIITTLDYGINCLTLGIASACGIAS